MSDINDKCLDVFPAWLENLGSDTQAILSVLMSDGLADEARRFLTGGINYLFKSLDLIPDGIDDIGYLDDSFVLRIAARASVEAGLGNVDESSNAKMRELADDTEIVKDFLGDDIFARLEKYTRNLVKGAARGRLVDEIVERNDIFREFAMEIESFVNDYKNPGFSKDEKNLIKLKAFFDAKLPK